MPRCVSVGRASPSLTVTVAIDGSIGGQALGRSEARTASEARELFGWRPGWMRDAATGARQARPCSDSLGARVRATWRNRLASRARTMAVYRNAKARPGRREWEGV